MRLAALGLQDTQAEAVESAVPCAPVLPVAVEALGAVGPPVVSVPLVVEPSVAVPLAVLELPVVAVQPAVVALFAVAVPVAGVESLVVAEQPAVVELFAVAVTVAGVEPLAVAEPFGSVPLAAVVPSVVAVSLAVVEPLALPSAPLVVAVAHKNPTASWLGSRRVALLALGWSPTAQARATSERTGPPEGLPTATGLAGPGLAAQPVTAPAGASSAPHAFDIGSCRCMISIDIMMISFNLLRLLPLLPLRTSCREAAPRETLLLDSWAAAVARAFRVGESAPRTSF